MQDHVEIDDTASFIAGKAMPVVFFVIDIKAGIVIIMKRANSGAGR